MNIPFIIALIGVFGGIYLWVGKNASKGLQNTEDYFLAKRTLGVFPICFTLLATQLGAGTLLGAAQEAFDKGWMVIFYPIGACIGLFILGMGFGGRLRRLNVTTIAEVFEKVYRSRMQRQIASALSIITLFFILVAQAVAIRAFFNILGIENPFILFGVWSVMVFYTVAGGLKAVVRTDIFQALFILIALAVVVSSLDWSSIALAKSNKEGFQSTNIGAVPWVNWLLMPLLFMLIEQDMGQRCFAAKNSKTVAYSAMLSGGLLLISSMTAIFLGVLAKDLNIRPEANSNILISSIAVLTNPTVAAIFMVAILLAVVSTADSLLCSISSNLYCDFMQLKKTSDKNKLKVSRLITLIVGIASLGISYFFNKRLLHNLMIF